MNLGWQLSQGWVAACLFWAHILATLLVPAASSALEIGRVQTCSGVVLRLRGDIKEGDFLRLKSHFRRKEAVVGFDLSSDGGILEEGLKIAHLTRRKKLTVYVADKCSSVCAAIFLAAAKRNFGAASKIGVHAVSNYRDVEDVGSKLLTIKLARLWAEEGVPKSAIGKMVATPPKEITYLDPTDLLSLDASEGDPFAYKVEARQPGSLHHCSDRAAKLTSEAGSGFGTRETESPQQLSNRRHARTTIEINSPP